MLYAAIPALLKAYLNANVVVTTIMLNYIAIELTEFLTKAFFQGDQSYDSTYAIQETAEIPKIMSRYRVSYAIFLAVAIVLVVWFVSRRTSFGYEISAIGRQLEFSEAVGMRVRKKIVLIFLISGAIAGVAGATEVLGVNKNFMPNFSTNPGLGWQGLLCGGAGAQQSPRGAAHCHYLRRLPLRKYRSAVQTGSPAGSAQHHSGRSDPLLFHQIFP